MPTLSDQVKVKLIALIDEAITRQSSRARHLKHQAHPNAFRHP